MLKKLKNALRRSEFWAKYSASARKNDVDMVFGSHIFSSSTKGRVLIVSHSQSQCGIQQYGLNTIEALRKSEKYDFRYAECSSVAQLKESLLQQTPSVIIYNHYLATMPWLSAEVTRRIPMIQLGVMHEVTQKEADEATSEMFDYHICPDPTLEERNSLVFKIPRLIPTYENRFDLPEVVTVGSFGFGFADKGFERLIQTVQDEFHEANIVLRLPFNDIVDVKGKDHALATAARCRGLITKAKINLSIKHDFISKVELLDFLASNTINCFFYDTQKERGISSTIEHALAVQRPLAITKCGMFRHVYDAEPSICIEESSLKEIISNDVTPLTPFYNEWSESKFIKSYEEILRKVTSTPSRSNF